MINYTTIINSVKYHKVEGNLENVIKSITVTKIGEDESGVRSDFTYKLDFDAPSESEFTPYESISKEMMLGWISAHPYEFDTKAEAYIASAIQEKIETNEVETSVLPFA